MSGGLAGLLEQARQQGDYAALLEQIPYEDLPAEKVKLPKRLDLMRDAERAQAGSR